MKIHVGRIYFQISVLKIILSTKFLIAPAFMPGEKINKQTQGFSPLKDVYVAKARVDENP